MRRFCKRFHILPFVLGLTLIGPSAHGQPGAGDAADTVEQVSLGTVLEVAVRQSPSLELASIDVEIADAQVLEARGVDDWVLQASTSYSAVRFAEFGLTELRNQAAGSVQLSKPLSTGGVVTLGANTRFSEGLPGISEDTWSDGVELTLFHPLLRGRGERYARANIARQRIARDAAELQVYVEATGVVRDIIRAYWNLAYARRDLEIRESSLDLARERLRITRAGIEGGAVAPTEALAVEQAIATREEEVLTAEVSVSERAIELRRLAGMEIGPDDIELATVAAPEVEPQEFDLHALLDRAYESSPELAVLEKRKEGSELEVVVTENGLLPRLDLNASFGPSGADTSFGGAVESLISFEEPSFSVGLTFEHDLGQRAAEGRSRASRQRLYQSKVTIRDMKAQIAAALVRAIKAAELAQARMTISQRAIGLAEQNIDAEKARFELGRATNFDVLQRQEELKQSQLRYARAAVDYLQARAQIDALTGGLLPKYGIDLDAAR